MTANKRSCCDEQSEPTAEQSSSGQVLSESAPGKASLPEELGTALGQFLGQKPVTTLDEWARALRQQVGGPLSIEELCTTDQETDHWGTVGDERRHFLCFYDAVILAALSPDPVEIHTQSPDGSVIEARAVGTELVDVTPPDAVFSIGIKPNRKPLSDGSRSLEDAYTAICPFVKAFPDVKSYEHWAESVSGATVGLSLDGAAKFAAALVEEG